MPGALRIGLTGGIGSGKSTVAEQFSALGAEVIDTDILARELVTPGQPALGEIIRHFGRDLLNPDQTLDREALRQRVFADESARHQLEAILHPRIRERALALAAGVAAPYCVIVIPLLVESGDDYPLDRVLVVDTSVELQIRRVMQRNGLSEQEVRRMLAAQADRPSRLAVADDLIHNENDLPSLRDQVATLHTRYLQLAKE